MENESKYFESSGQAAVEDGDESEAAVASLEEAFLQAMQKGDLTREQIEHAYQVALERRDNG